MLTEICQELHNWFDFGLPKYSGKVEVKEGAINDDVLAYLNLKENQYFRIKGSIFNDGVYQFKSSLRLVDEDFCGEVWAMAVPSQVIALSAEIEQWQAKYGGADSILMSPYSAESFGGYSYNKSQGYRSNGSSLVSSWKDVYSSRLNAWRKI